MRPVISLFFLSFIVMNVDCYAGKAHVVEVRIERMADNTFTVHATVQHDDDGWKHSADRWEILDMEGNLLDTRVLMHPHTKEPFTRSIPRAKIPPGIKKIRIRAHDSIHGYGGEEKVAELPKP